MSILIDMEIPKSCYLCPFCDYVSARCDAVKGAPYTPPNRYDVRADWCPLVPAADVRPVVYCKDCVHFIRGELFGDMVCDYHYLHHYHAEPNEFCSHAEKREESMI